ncbi:hypothetical protein JW905_16045, partial [bacterium]|nr:hypothetical protein [candidate division CSSED10-310 bacterium]
MWRAGGWMLICLCICGISTVAVLAGDPVPAYWIALRDVPELQMQLGMVKKAVGMPSAGRSDVLVLTQAEYEHLAAGTPTLLEFEQSGGENRSAKAIGLISADASRIIEVLKDYDAYTRVFREDLRETHPLARLADGSNIVAFRVFDHWPKKKYYTNRIH